MDEVNKPFDWLQGGPLLEVGFLTELDISHAEFLSNFMNILKQTKPAAEIVSSIAELNAAETEFLRGYPWDPNDVNSVTMHSWAVLARFQFRELRECSIKINQISDCLVHINFYFWGDEDDGWGQKGLKNEELPEFVLFLRSLARLSQFPVGTIGFGTWTMFLFSTDESWPHPDYDLKNLTSEVMKANSDEFICVVARDDFVGLPLVEVRMDEGYIFVKLDDAAKQSNQSLP